MHPNISLKFRNINKVQKSLADTSCSMNNVIIVVFKTESIIFIYGGLTLACYELIFYKSNLTFRHIQSAVELSVFSYIRFDSDM